MKRFFVQWLALLRQARDPLRSAAAPASGDDRANAVPMLDCESVMRQLWDYLDRELTPDRMAAIRAHLELCKRCYPQYEFERSFLEAVGGSMREHSNLEGLRARLMIALASRGLEQEQERE